LSEEISGYPSIGGKEKVRKIPPLTEPSLPAGYPLRKEAAETLLIPSFSGLSFDPDSQKEQYPNECKNNCHTFLKNCHTLFGKKVNKACNGLNFPAPWFSPFPHPPSESRS
jgi:hypothetical protein